MGKLRNKIIGAGLIVTTAGMLLWCAQPTDNPKPKPPVVKPDPNAKLTPAEIKALEGSASLDVAGPANLFTINNDGYASYYAGREAYDKENYNMNKELKEFNDSTSSWYVARNVIWGIMGDIRAFYDSVYAPLAQLDSNDIENMEMSTRVNDVLMHVVNDLDTNNLTQSVQDLNQLLTECENYLPIVRTYLANHGGGLNPEIADRATSRLSIFENRTIYNIKQLMGFLMLAKQENQSFSTKPCMLTPESAGTYSLDGALQTGYNDILLKENYPGYPGAYERFLNKLNQQLSQSHRGELDAAVARSENLYGN